MSASSTAAACKDNIKVPSEKTKSNAVEQLAAILGVATCKRDVNAGFRQYVQGEVSWKGASGSAGVEGSAGYSEAGCQQLNAMAAELAVANEVIGCVLTNSTNATEVNVDLKQTINVRLDGCDTSKGILSISNNMSGISVLGADNQSDMNVTITNALKGMLTNIADQAASEDVGWGSIGGGNQANISAIQGTIRNFVDQSVITNIVTKITANYTMSQVVNYICTDSITGDVPITQDLHFDMKTTAYSKAVLEALFETEALGDLKNSIQQDLFSKRAGVFDAFAGMWSNILSVAMIIGGIVLLVVLLPMLKKPSGGVAGPTADKVRKAKIAFYCLIGVGALLTGFAGYVVYSTDANLASIIFLIASLLLLFIGIGGTIAIHKKNTTVSITNPLAPNPLAPNPLSSTR